MLGFSILVVYFIAAVSGFPTNYVRKIAETQQFDDFENFLPKYDDLPNFQYPTNSLDDELSPLKNSITLERTKENGEKRSKINLVEDALSKIDFQLAPVQGSDVPAIADISQASTQEPEYSTTIFTEPDVTTTDLAENLENTTLAENTNMSSISSDTNTETFQLKPGLNISDSEFNETNRLPRQESNDTKSDPEFESQEDDSSEEDGNMITGLLSTFLGGLSRPDGSIDLEAIVGLLGSLSTQNDDGSYDFQGLTDLLMGLFGGGGEEGGGSDIGAFVGGLVGAIIKGVANPPGAKGAGIFTGKIVTGVLPALSGPAPVDTENGDKPQPEGLDSGGFLSGLLKTVLGSSGGGTQEEGGGGSKFNIFKLVFSLITSVFSSSSQSH